MFQHQPLTVWCFHGCGQNPVVFQRLTSALRQRAPPEWTFEYPQGFYPLKSSGHSWYTNTDSKSVYREPRSHPHMKKLYARMVTSERRVLLLGFSEGAMLACDLALRFSKERTSPLVGVVALAPSFFNKWQSDIVSPLTLLLVTSPSDMNVRPKESQKWWNYFSTTQHFETYKGHKVHFPSALRKLIFQTFVTEKQNDGVRKTKKRNP